MFALQELESLHQSRKTAYQRFISHQEDLHVKRGTRRENNKVGRDDAASRSHRRGRLDISMSISHRWIQRSRNIEVNTTKYVHTQLNIHCSLSKFLTFVYNFRRLFFLINRSLPFKDKYYNNNIITFNM